MLIGIDANEANLTQNRVGINQYAFNLLHALHARKTEHKFVIYLKNAPLSDLPLPGANWDYRVIPAPILWTQTRLPFDLYFHSPRPNVFLSLTHYSPRWSPIPTVVTIMDLGFLKNPEQFTSKDYNQLKNWTHYSIRNAKKIIAISHHTKKDIETVYGIDPANITVTHLGYDVNLFKPTKNLKVLQKYSIQEPYFLFLGSLRPSKNIEGLIKAFSQFSQKNYHLVISGKKAWLYDRIFELVMQLRLEARVIFTGFIQEEEVPVLMTSATAFVMPSFYEGFGIPVLEAMACGTPVIVSEVASLPEVAGIAGIYCDPNSVESITHALNVSVGAQRKIFLKRVTKRAQIFSWETCALQTLSVLESAV